MPEQHEEPDAGSQPGVSKISIGFKSYEVGKRYYNPGEQGSEATIVSFRFVPGSSGLTEAGHDARFTIEQEVSGQEPIISEISTEKMLKYNEDRRTGTPLSHERAQEIRECNPDALKVRGRDTTPLKEAQVVRVAFDMILRK